MWNCGNLSLRCQGRSPSGDHHEASVPMRSTGADQPVRAMKAGNAAGAKGLGQAVVLNVQLATGGDLGGNEAVRHPGVDAVRLLGGSGVSREAPAPFCERPEVKLLRPTRHSLHWVLDVVFADDQSRLRKGRRACARATARTTWPSCAISPQPRQVRSRQATPGAITSETRAQTRLQTQGNEPQAAPENGRVEQRLHADSPRRQNALTWMRSPGAWQGDRLRGEWDSGTGIAVLHERFCQGSRRRPWPTRARLGIGPPL